MPPQLELWRTGVSWWVFLMVHMDPMGHVEHNLFGTLLPEVTVNPSNPVKTLHVLMLFGWSCGGQECPDGLFQGQSQTANCLRSILSFYRPQKACKTPKLWLFESWLQFWYFASLFSGTHMKSWIWFGRDPPFVRKFAQNHGSFLARGFVRIFSLRAGPLWHSETMTWPT